MNSRGINRREFAGTVAAVAALSSVTKAAEARPYRVAVIGHTGRGDYGHGLDTMWRGLPETQVVAVADPNPRGRAAAAQRLGDVPAFDDYRAMLAQTQPDIVAVCMRHIDQHHEVTLAAIEAGARGIYIEKPFCRSPREADEIVAAAAARNVKVAVAHRNRYHPVLPVVKRLIEAGEIGRPLEYRLRGKEDARGGTLDLWVLGSHLMNLLHYLAGLPRACSATVLIDGRLATKDDATEGAEGIGRMAGNEVHARFEMENGLFAYFDSIVRAGDDQVGFGLQLIGTEGIIDLRVDREPLARLCPGSPFPPKAKATQWLAISTAGVGQPEPLEEMPRQVAAHWWAGRDLLESIAQDRQPLCGAADAAVTIEMITAVAQSHLLNAQRIEWPLASRDNPWA